MAFFTRFLIKSLNNNTNIKQSTIVVWICLNTKPQFLKNIHICTYSLFSNIIPWSFFVKLSIKKVFGQLHMPRCSEIWGYDNFYHVPTRCLIQRTSSYRQMPKCIWFDPLHLDESERLSRIMTDSFPDLCRRLSACSAYFIVNQQSYISLTGSFQELKENLFSTLFVKIPIPAETSSESFWTSDMT